MTNKLTWAGEFADADAERTFREDAIERYRYYYKTALDLGAVAFVISSWLHFWLTQIDFPAQIDQVRMFFAVILIVGIAATNYNLTSSVALKLVFGLALAMGVAVTWAIQLLPPEHYEFSMGFLIIHCSLEGILPRPVKHKIITIATFLTANALLLSEISDPRFWLLAVFLLSVAIAVSFAIGSGFALFERKLYLLQQDLRSAKSKTDQLLHQIMPQGVAAQLQSGSPESTLVDRERVAVLFADLAGFTQWSSAKSPATVVKVLDQIFRRFDRQVTCHRTVKIKTIGDGYLAVSGLPDPVDDCAREIAELALELREAVKKYSLLMGIPLEVRIGIHFGPVTAGVIGQERPHYDLWGDTVNVAARMEAAGVEGAIQTTRETMMLLKDHHEFESRGEIDVKGKGRTEVYILKGPLPQRETPLGTAFALSAA